MSYRIGQFLSRAKYCSRRSAAAFLEENRVEYKNERITDLSFRISEDDAAGGCITVNGQTVSLSVKEPLVILLNKPVGYLCSHRSQGDRKTIFSLLPDTENRLYYAGRLDADSRGLVVLSDDGDLIYRLSHPSYSVFKKYLVTTNRPLAEAEIQKLLKGVYEGGEKLQFHKLTTLKPAHYEVWLKQGRKREIRRAIGRCGCRVKDLFRFQLGDYTVDNIAEGSYREVKPALSQGRREKPARQ